jgi:hypothetical protein
MKQAMKIFKNLGGNSNFDNNRELRKRPNRKNYY